MSRGFIPDIFVSHPKSQPSEVVVIWKGGARKRADGVLLFRRNKRTSEQSGLCSDVVPVVGLEPTRCRQRRILNPLRLPFHHTGEGTHLLYRMSLWNSRVDFPLPQNFIQKFLIPPCPFPTVSPPAAKSWKLFLHKQYFTIFTLNCTQIVVKLCIVYEKFRCFYGKLSLIKSYLNGGAPRG